MEEVIRANNISGECLMLWYCKHLKLVNEEQLYFHAIITQQNFTNTIYIDKDSNLSQTSEKSITDAVKKSGKYCDPNIEKYLKNR